MQLILTGIFFLFQGCNGFSANSFASTLKSMTLTENQQKYYNLLKDDESPIVVCTGPSGSGFFL